MSLIPKTIYQSWKTKNLPVKMSKIVEKVRQLNPEYQYILYDDDDCRAFLLKHFGQNYANAFDSLVPGAYKCDFWRYAMLYVHGGVYLDIDMEPLVPFREIIDPGNEFVSIVDRKLMLTPKCIIYQAFIAVTPKHPIIYNSLLISYINIVSRRHEIFDALSITGPIVVGIAMNLYWKNKITHKEIHPGVYDNNKIKLITRDDHFTYNLNGEKVIKNKFEGYSRGSFDYATTKNYHDDPRSKHRKIVLYCIIGIILVAIIGVILTFIFKKKWNKCEESCSSR